MRAPLEEIITLDYGSGGKKTSSLIEELLVPAFQNEALSALGDGAVLKHQGDLVFSTDSYVISPYFFPGGDIGKLSVCGTVNDLAMCGGTPRYLSVGFILEEGPPDRNQAGDTVSVSGTVGDHGTAVMLARSGMMEAAAIQSDCMPLNRLAEAALSCGGVRVLRDPTRGGVATTLNEFVENSAFSIELEECAVPVAEGVASACDILGLDPLYCANEGKMLVIADRDAADEILAALRRTPGGENAAAIGSVTTQYPGKVVLKTFLGGSRILAKLTGAQLPRIC